MIILPIVTTPLIHLSLEGWENVLFELGSERVYVSQVVSDADLHPVVIVGD